MPPVVQGRRAPGPADAARFGVDWVRLGLGLASISVLLSQDCPRLRGCPPSGTAAPGVPPWAVALGCRSRGASLDFRSGFPLGRAAVSGASAGGLSAGMALSSHNIIVPPRGGAGKPFLSARRRFFPGQGGGRELRAGGRREKTPQSGVEGRAGSLVLAGRRSRGAHCRSALSQRSFPLQESPVQSGCLPPSPRLPFATPPERPVRWLS